MLHHPLLQILARLLLSVSLISRKRRRHSVDGEQSATRWRLWITPWPTPQPTLELDHGLAGCFAWATPACNLIGGGRRPWAVPHHLHHPRRCHHDDSHVDWISRCRGSVGHPGVVHAHMAAKRHNVVCADSAHQNRRATPAHAASKTMISPACSVIKAFRSSSILATRFLSAGDATQHLETCWTERRQNWCGNRHNPIPTTEARRTSHVRSDKTAVRNRLQTTHQRHECSTSVVIGGDQEGPHWLTFTRRSGNRSDFHV